MKAGYFIGSFAPYGYRKDPENKGHLLIDEETAPIVREIFSLYIHGTGRTSIARILNERGIPSPGEYHRLRCGTTFGSPKKNSRFWKYDTIGHILQNEVYIGNLVQGKTFHPTYKAPHSIPSDSSKWVRIENTHEPIIDRITWNRTRELWASRSKPCYDGTVNPYSGVLVCAKCGYHMSVAYNRKKRYFRCASAKYGKACCEGTTVFETTLEKAIRSEMQRWKEQYLNPDLTLREKDISSCAQDNRKRQEQMLTVLNRNLTDTDRAMKNLYLDKLKGFIDEDQFLDVLQDLRQEKNNYISQIKALKNEPDQDGLRHDRQKEIASAIREMLSFQDITREVVSRFIKRIEIDGTKQNRTIDIYWKF